MLRETTLCSVEFAIYKEQMFWYNWHCRENIKHGAVGSCEAGGGSMAGSRIIFHIDVNSAFLSWEAVYRLRCGQEGPDLRSVPSAVGGDMAMRHGVILAKSIPAKKYGVQTGEPIVDAQRKCPGLLVVPPRRGLYSECSRAFMDILRKYTDVVEQYSIDEAFMDMTGTEKLFGSPWESAHKIKDEIRDSLGFTVLPST